MTVLFNYTSMALDDPMRPAYSPIPSACFSWILILVAIVVSSRRPERWDQQGSILRSYFASWIGVFSFDVIRESLLSAYGFNGLNIFLEAFIDLAGWYFATATVLWLNVMIYDIWKRFWDSRHSQDLTTIESAKSRFVFYSIYAWGCSGLEIPMMIYAISTWNDEWSLLMTLRAIVFSCTYICNILLIISTAIMIERREGDKLCSNSTVRVCPEIKKWFISCVRLFLLTILYDILMIPIEYQGSFFDISSILETLHGVPIFLMFV